jgi:poly(A) polymerase
MFPRLLFQPRYATLQLMEQSKPRIIPRPEHIISRSQLSSNAVRALYRLKEQGFTAYLVGGCVRDLLLGREPKDFDLVTDATPGQVKRLFRNCRLVGRRFRLAHLHFADEIIEVATFRAAEPDEPDEEELFPVTPRSPEPSTGERARPPRHLKSEEGVVLRDNVFGTPAQDAMRRDFTVNALFYNIADFSIIDYTEGMDDLRNGVIRTIGEPAARFTEDPVRMLRAVRFAAILGFTIEDATWKALAGQSATITRAAPPRLYEEMLKLFLSGEGEKGYQLLRRSGLFGALFPRFSDWLEQESDGFPHAMIGKALEWIDRQVQEGVKIPPPSLLALMFGEYLEERGENFRRGGAPPQQSLDLAVAEFLSELAPTVLVPHKVGVQVRDILAYQPRFRKTPGKHPLSFISRPSFSAALDYFHFACITSGGDLEFFRWWEQFLLDNQDRPSRETVDKETSSSSREQGKRRRRKRRPKKRSGEHPS